MRLCAEDLHFQIQDLLCKPTRERTPEEDERLMRTSEEAMDFLDQALAELERGEDTPKKRNELTYKLPVERAIWHAARGEWKDAQAQALRAMPSTQQREGAQRQQGISAAEVWERVACFRALSETEDCCESLAVQEMAELARRAVRRYEEEMPVSKTSTERLRREHVVRWMWSLCHGVVGHP